ncbi:hypothetical protein C7974DRAFT_438513 [Boeremia exigua]|uniref:uncharacterized protein n=1 Tax=Boeremia exigua TaxID=749465 RepID=UPI001E8E3A87|nr:uncharacterized protein C7974DRAFT_438513 [Boeremia exigua]KAH6643581.1 hypothetical protein C7974DRAFT_438513 [Boeremia exigua]
MSAGPPFGQPWCANIGSNPNINRDPPPPPLNVVPGSAPVPAAAGNRAVVGHQQAPIYSPPVPIGIAPPFGLAPPFGAGFGTGMFPSMPFMDPLMYGGGPLAPIRTGNFIPGAHGGIGFGLHAAGGMPFPPPPPGALATGVVPPFAPTVPLWSSGLTFGNVPPMGAGMIPPMMPMGMGMGMGIPGHAPAPLAVDGNTGAPPQPPQADVTQLPGGIPPGATHVEAAEHTLFIQIKGTVCPWLSPGAQLLTEMLHISSSTGLNRLIQVCNNNADDEGCENMAITECIELGNGLWEKGQTFKYGDAVARVLTMKCVGWDNSRNRLGGQSLHIWLHRI